MSTQELIASMIAQLTDEGFIQDEDEKSYTLIDYRGTHKVITYWVEGLWVTFTQTVEDDNGLQTTLFDDLIKTDPSGA